MRKVLLLVVVVVSVFVLTGSRVTAQVEPVKTIYGGVVNGKAVSLPFPEYTEEARRLKLSGTVIVDVTLDENGTVVSAKAAEDTRTINPPGGEKADVPPADPILREAAEKAALQAKFPRTLLSGNPIKVAGTILYKITVGGRPPSDFNNTSTAAVGGISSTTVRSTNEYRGPVQTASPALPKTLSGGVLNGKASSLPKPPYPPAARAVNAEGAVSVQVLIDEEGNVASANAISGHPLLRAAAVEAARAAKFNPTLLSGAPVKVSGVITYNFVGTFTPGMLGYELAYAERTGKFAEYSFAKSLAARLPEDWTAERETLESLRYQKPVVEKEAEKTAAVTVRDRNVYTVMSDNGRSYAQKKLTPESIEALRDLLSSVEARLNTEQVRQWHFKLGKGLGTLVAEIEDDNKLRINVAELEQLAASVPPTVSAAAMARLNELIELARTAESGAEGRQALTAAAQSLRNLRISQW